MLELLGAVFLLILGFGTLLSAITWIWLRARVKEALVINALESSLSGIELPVLRPVEEDQSYHPAEVACLSAEFFKIGAKRVDDYCLAELDNTHVSLLRFNIPPAFVAINDHPERGCWADLIMLPVNGGTLTYTTMSESLQGENRPPQHELIQVERSTHPASLLGYARSRALGGEFLATHNVDFVSIFNTMMREYHDHFTTSDVEQDWLESIASNSGVKLCGEEAESINSERRALRNQQVVDNCLQAYAECSGLTALQWEQIRNDLVVIHEGLTAESLVELLYDLLNLPQGYESELVKLEFEDAPVRYLANSFNAQLPDSHGMVRVATITSPVVADIYRLPDTAADIDLLNQAA